MAVREPPASLYQNCLLCSHDKQQALGYFWGTPTTGQEGGGGGGFREVSQVHGWVDSEVCFTANGLPGSIQQQPTTAPVQQAAVLCEKTHS